MRDNGLTAASYAEMGGVEPSVTDAVLSSLAEAGIAAYAEAGDGARADAAEGARPVRPMDRLYVDEASAERARVVIARSSEDAEWKSLVEQFNEPGAGDKEQVPRWPASEDVDEEKQDTTDDAPVRITADPEEEHSVRAVKDPHEHYIPPEPPQGPRLDWISRIAWAGVIGGPLLLVLVALLDLGSGSRVTLIGALGFAGGFLTLVFRMKDRLPDDTPDDGAVV